jgi:hypothetical protein
VAHFVIYKLDTGEVSFWAKGPDETWAGEMRASRFGSEADQWGILAAPSSVEERDVRVNVHADPPTIEDYVAATTPEALQQEILAATQRRLDEFARTRNYDGILSAATYATSTVEQFAAEGQRAVELRDQTWATLYQMLAEVQAGTRPTPTCFDDIAGELPALKWGE